MASASLYNNPAFASGLSDMLRGFLGNPTEEARNQVLAAQAGELNDTARYREAIGKATNLDQMLIAALQAGGEFGRAAPGIASSRASLPGAGYTPEELAQIQIGTGTQTAQGTMPGLEATLANRLEGIRIPLDYEREDRAAGNAAFQQALREGLLRRGFSPNVAEGFMLNFGDESGFDPGINEAAPVVPGSRGGFGLYQLTGPRREAYERYAMQRGVDPSDPNAQLDFLKAEWMGPEAAAARAIEARSGTVGDAASAIATYFLRPSAEHLESRVRKYTGYDTAAPGADIEALLLGAGNPALDTRQSDILQMLAEHYLDQDEGGGGDVSLTGEFEIDGVVYGKTKSGQLLPYTGPDGQPLRVDAGVPPAVGATPGTPMPPEAPGTLQTPFAASPYRQEPTMEEMLAAELSAPEGEMAPGMDPQQMEPFGLFPERPMKSYARSALIDALGMEEDPMMGLSIVAAAEAMLRDNPAMTETQALAYASNPDNLRRGPTEESMLPFGLGDKEGPVVGMKQPPEVEAILQEARDAIAAGADPAAVQARLRQMGISAPL